MVFELTPPGETIALVAITMSIVGALIRYAVMDKDVLKTHKQKIKHHQEKMKEAQKNKDMKGMQKHQSELMSATMEQMKHSMKPMIFTFLPFILVFKWLRGNFSEEGEVVIILGKGFGWLGWYIITSMVVGIFINKIFGNT